MNGFPQGEDLSFGEEGKHLLDEVGSDTFDLSFNRNDWLGRIQWEGRRARRQRHIPAGGCRFHRQDKSNPSDESLLAQVYPAAWSGREAARSEAWWFGDQTDPLERVATRQRICDVTFGWVDSVDVSLKICAAYPAHGWGGGAAF